MQFTSAPLWTPFYAKLKNAVLHMWQYDPLCEELKNSIISIFLQKSNCRCTWIFCAPLCRTHFISNLVIRFPYWPLLWGILSPLKNIFIFVFHSIPLYTFLLQFLLKHKEKSIKSDEQWLMIFWTKLSCKVTGDIPASWEFVGEFVGTTSLFFVFFLSFLDTNKLNNIHHGVSGVINSITKHVM